MLLSFHMNFSWNGLGQSCLFSIKRSWCRQVSRRHHNSAATLMGLAEFSLYSLVLWSPFICFPFSVHSCRISNFWCFIAYELCNHSVWFSYGIVVLLSDRFHLLYIVQSPPCVRRHLFVIHCQTFFAMLKNPRHSFVALIPGHKFLSLFLHSHCFIIVFSSSFHLPRSSVAVSLWQVLLHSVSFFIASMQFFCPLPPFHLWYSLIIVRSSSYLLCSLLGIISSSPILQKCCLSPQFCQLPVTVNCQPVDSRNFLITIFWCRIPRFRALASVSWSSFLNRQIFVTISSSPSLPRSFSSHYLDCHFFDPLSLSPFSLRAYLLTSCPRDFSSPFPLVVYCQNCPSIFFLAISCLHFFMAISCHHFSSPISVAISGLHYFIFIFFVVFCSNLSGATSSWIVFVACTSWQFQSYCFFVIFHSLCLCQWLFFAV